MTIDRAMTKKVRNREANDRTPPLSSKRKRDTISPDLKTKLPKQCKVVFSDADYVAVASRRGEAHEPQTSDRLTDEQRAIGRHVLSELNKVVASFKANHVGAQGTDSARHAFYTQGTEIDLALSAIDTDAWEGLPTTTVETTDATTLARLRWAIQLDGYDRTDKVHLVCTDGKYYILDGRHRVAALRELLAAMVHDRENAVNVATALHAKPKKAFAKYLQHAFLWDQFLPWKVIKESRVFNETFSLGESGQNAKWPEKICRLLHGTVDSAIHENLVKSKRDTSIFAARLFLLDVAEFFYLQVDDPKDFRGRGSKDNYPNIAASLGVACRFLIEKGFPRIINRCETLRPHPDSIMAGGILKLLLQLVVYEELDAKTLKEFLPTVWYQGSAVDTILTTLASAKNVDGTPAADAHAGDTKNDQGMGAEPSLTRPGVPPTKDDMLLQSGDGPSKKLKCTNKPRGLATPSPEPEVPRFPRRAKASGANGCNLYKDHLVHVDDRLASSDHSPASEVQRNSDVPPIKTTQVDSNINSPKNGDATAKPIDGDEDEVDVNEGATKKARAGVAEYECKKSLANRRDGHIKLVKCVRDHEGPYVSLKLPTMLKKLDMTLGDVPQDGACGFSALYGSTSRTVKVDDEHRLSVVQFIAQLALHVSDKTAAFFGRGDCQSSSDVQKYFLKVLKHVAANETVPKDLWMASGVTCLAASLWQKPVYVLEAHPCCKDAWRLSRVDAHEKETVFTDIEHEAEAMKTGHVLVLQNNHYTHLARWWPPEIAKISKNVYNTDDDGADQEIDPCQWNELENLMGCGDSCTNKVARIECYEDICSATEVDWCTNRPFQRPSWKAVRVEDMGEKGFGLVADEDIRKGDLIIEYVGEVIGAEDCARRQADKTDTYLVLHENGFGIDARLMGNESRFINHACKPNARAEKWTSGGRWRIVITASKDIASGDEITFNYELMPGRGLSEKCLCGHTNVCRGV